VRLFWQGLIPNQAAGHDPRAVLKRRKTTLNCRTPDYLKCLTFPIRSAAVVSRPVSSRWTGRRSLAAFFAGLLLAAAPLVSAQDLAAPTTPSAPQAAPAAPAQNAGGIRGQVADPSGAVIPGANIVVLDTAGKTVGKATADAGGVYAVHGIPPGTYSVWVTAPGFAVYRVPNIAVAAGQIKTLNPALQIQMQQQQVEVQAENTTIGTAADANASAIVIKGSDLNALSDDPDELQNELQALAGPSAGPNGGQIYIDGFTGGQLPPKSSIREIRVNQNPFSAEYDRLGYGRIEIFTKPGTDKLHGQAEITGNDSAFNSQNPILTGKSEPSYSSWMLHGSVGGPINKNASYFVSIFSRSQQNEAILEAIDPTTVYLGSDGNATGTSINEAIDNPTSRLSLSPRVDLQLGKANTLTVRYEYNRGVNTNGGLNPLSLPSQAINTNQQENTLQLSDSLILSPKLVDDIRFQYRRIRNNQNLTAIAYNAGGQPLPSVTVQGAFSDGSSNSQIVQDHENDFELQNYFSGAFGAHSLNFGARLRSYDDVNYSTSGSNGSYTFGSLNDYLGCVQPSEGTCQPQQYSYNYIQDPLARAILFDAGLFYQDDWKVNPRLTFSYGARWETQNRINDKNDWAPRISVAYALGRGTGKQQPKTVIRAGYGWFYQRFTVANGFGAQVPFIVNAIHQNGVNEKTFIQTSGIAFDSTQPTKITSGGGGTGRAAPTQYSIDPNMKTANDMEGAVGVDRQLSKFMTGNVTYVFSQGIHQYFTDNLSAAAAEIDAGGFANDEYPGTEPAEPPDNNLQYQSGGFYREHQLMATIRANYRNFSFFTNYTYSNAKGDTSGIGSVPSVSSNPGLDYGRTSFAIEHRVMVFGNVMFPWHISASPMLVANSGTPFNVTTGQDLTGNNQFNARPTYAASCTEAGAVQTSLGCFNLNPFGTSEKIVPYGLGTGPSNVSVNMRLNKVIGIGPKLGEGEHAAGGGGGFHGGPPGLGGGGFSGSRGGPGRMDQAVSRKYSLNLGVWATNILNHENLGTPNGVIPAGQPLGAGLPGSFFGQSQSLAGGFFGPQSGGNRSIYLQASFSF
jgi:hypothetical protein